MKTLRPVVGILKGRNKDIVMAAEGQASQPSSAGQALGALGEQGGGVAQSHGGRSPRKQKRTQVDASLKNWHISGRSFIWGNGPAHAAEAESQAGGLFKGGGRRRDRREGRPIGNSAMSK